MRRRQFVGRLGAVVMGSIAVPALGQTLDTVTIGAVNSVADAPFLIADRKGYFRDAGIKANFIPFDSGALMNASLGTGQIDTGGGAPGPGLYNAIVRGIPLKIVADRARSAPGYGVVPLVVRKDLVTGGKYRSYSDLKGLKVAEPAKGSTSLPELERLLETVHLTYDDVDHVYMGFSDQVVAFRNGSIDASVLLEPWATQATQDGYAIKIAGNDTWYPNQQLAGILYSNVLMQKRPDVAKRLMVAYVRGVRYYLDALRGGRMAGPTAEDVIAILTSALKVDPTVLRVMTPAAIDPDGRVNVTSLSYDYGVFKKYGLLTGDVSMNQVVDMSYADAASKALGPYRPRR
jgi:NitT/TauT family transport system substrate-binding protein